MLIKMVNISKKMKEQIVLNDISLELKSGMVYGLKGKNGSGKTMLMRVICGLVKPTSGEIWFDDMKLGRDISFPDSVGALIEHPGFIDGYNAYDNLKYLIQIRNRVGNDHIEKVLEWIGLKESGKKRYKKFSLGMKQKLGIAAAIIEEPELIILDEPTNALDEETIEKIKRMIKYFKTDGKLIILACHDTEKLLDVSDVIISMNDGKISSVFNRAEQNV